MNGLDDINDGCLPPTNVEKPKGSKLFFGNPLIGERSPHTWEEGYCIAR